MARVTKKMAKLTKVVAPQIGGFPPMRAPILARDLRLLSAGHAPVKHEWIHHRFAFTAVGFVVSGHGTYRVDDGPETPVDPGTVFCVWPGPVFHYGATDGKTRPPIKPGGVSPTAWDEYHVCLEGPGINRLIKAGLLWHSSDVFRVDHVNEHIARWRELLAVFRRAGAGDGERASLMSERLLLELYFSRATGNPARPPSPAVEAVIAHCRSHFAQPINWHALARRHAMSYSLLRQRVRQVTGLPPARFVHQVRCDAARALLSDTDLPVKEVAGKVGIEDPYEFSRVFKRAVGVSPREYRRRAEPWRMGAK
jgi:AraC family transcriptional regulator of arabinose operon